MDLIPTKEQILLSNENVEIITKLWISCSKTNINLIILRDSKKYSTEILFSDLKNKNDNNFQYFPTTSIFINGIKKLITKKSFSLEIHNDKAILKLLNPLFDNPIIIEIPYDNKDLKERLNYSEELQKLQNKNEILEKEIERLKLQIEAKNNIKEIKINKEEEIINQMFLIFKESELTKKECNLLYNWINLANKNINFSLLYSAKIDGDKASSFHKKCDGKSPTITIFKTTNGSRFGGYRTKPWIKSSSWKYFKDEDAFIFSFFYNKKYKIKSENEDAIGCHEIRGPSFGYDCQDIYIWEECTQCNDNKCQTPHSYLTTQKSELTNGDTNFKVDHYEVYLIDY